MHWHVYWTPDTDRMGAVVYNVEDRDSLLVLLRSAATDNPSANLVITSERCKKISGCKAWPVGGS